MSRLASDTLVIETVLAIIFRDDTTIFVLLHIVDACCLPSWPLLCMRAAHEAHRGRQEAYPWLARFSLSRREIGELAGGL